MKDNHIVASFDKVTLSIDREDALLARILTQADAERASLEKEQKMNTEYRPNQTTNPNGKNSYRIPKKRKALLIAIAAVLLLLSACAAYAIYWSSTQRAKEYSQSEQAVDDRRVLAERSADEIIAGTTFYGAISGSAEVDGVTLTLKSASYWPNDDPPELHLAFNAVDAKANDRNRLYDFDYTLTVGGKTYPAYAKADGTARALPIIVQADTMAEGAEYEMWFRMDDGQAMTDSTLMTLAGELYAYDENEQRGNSLGSFSLDFIYTVPHAQIEAERERLIAEILGNIEEHDSATKELLLEQPDAATELNITQGVFTLVDVAVSEKGILLGTIGEVGWLDKGVNTYHTKYLDGYEWVGTRLNTVYDEHKEEGKNILGDYPKTMTALTLLPWYAPIEELPETVLVAIISEGYTKTFGVGDGDAVYTSEVQKIEIALRINPRTGAVSLPADDAEQSAWCEESLRLAADGRNDELVATLSGEQTINGVTVRLQQLHVQTKTLKAYVTCEVDGIYYPGEMLRCLMSADLNGLPLGTESAEALMRQYSFSEKAAQQWVDSNGGWKKLNGRCIGQGFEIKQPPHLWPDTFTLRIVLELCDRDQEWNLVPIGTFDISATVTQDDVVLGTAEDVYDLLI